MAAEQEAEASEGGWLNWGRRLRPPEAPQAGGSPARRRPAGGRFGEEKQQLLHFPFSSLRWWETEAGSCHAPGRAESRAVALIHFSRRFARKNAEEEGSEATGAGRRFPLCGSYFRPPRRLFLAAELASVEGPEHASAGAARILPAPGNLRLFLLPRWFRRSS